MMMAVILLVAILAAVTLLSLRFAQWCQQRIGLRSDTAQGLFLLLLLLGWWLAGAFFATTARGMDDALVGLSAILFVISATALLIWSYRALKKNQLSS